MNITIVGAGNIGTQFATHCAEKLHNVKVYCSKPGKINKELTIVNENGLIIHKGTIELATNNPEEAFNDADLIFVSVPAFCMVDTAKVIEPYANEKMKICLLPGTGGGECAFKGCIDKGATIFGLQRVPSVARLVEYGKTVRAIGYRDELFVASIPSNNVENCSEIINSLLDIKCSTMPNYLNLTLTPSNPILHTTRLRVLFKDYYDGMTYGEVPLFYEGWNDETSELLFKCDDEVQMICKYLDCYDLSYVKSLKVHYESDTPSALTKKITSIKGFKGLTSPVVSTPKGLVPDFESRYFTADFSYGLSILVQIAKLLGISTPNMISTLEWYYSVAGKRIEFDYSEFDINTKQQLIDFYSK